VKLPPDVEVMCSVVVPKVTVIGDVGAKAEPVTVTVVPTGPDAGLRLIVGAITVNVADAKYPAASSAVTAPVTEPAGIVRDAVKDPVELEVA
jgi:hypothetical protein